MILLAYPVVSFEVTIISKLACHHPWRLSMRVHWRVEFTGTFLHFLFHVLDPRTEFKCVDDCAWPSVCDDLLKPDNLLLQLVKLIRDDGDT